MQVADKIAALFQALRLEELEAMPPAKRRRFADSCRHWANLAEPKSAPAKSGVLADLSDGGKGRQ